MYEGVRRGVCRGAEKMKVGECERNVGECVRVDARKGEGGRRRSTRLTFKHRLELVLIDRTTTVLIILPEHLFERKKESKKER